MAAPTTVDEYIAGFPPEVADRLRRIREVIVTAVGSDSGEAPEERIRYGMPAVMFGGRYALHFAGWKKHIGLYPVHELPEPLEAEVAPRRSGKDAVGFPHKEPLPVELISRITRAIVELRSKEVDG